MDSLISWSQTGAESFPPEHLLFWAATGSAGQDDPIKVLVLYDSPLQQTCPALPSRWSFGLSSFLHSIDYTEELNPGSL